MLNNESRENYGEETAESVIEKRLAKLSKLLDEINKTIEGKDELIQQAVNMCDSIKMDIADLLDTGGKDYSDRVRDIAPIEERINTYLTIKDGLKKESEKVENRAWTDLVDATADPTLEDPDRN